MRPLTASTSRKERKVHVVTGYISRKNLRTFENLKCVDSAERERDARDALHVHYKCIALALHVHCTRMTRALNEDFSIKSEGDRR